MLLQFFVSVLLVAFPETLAIPSNITGISNDDYGKITAILAIKGGQWDINGNANAKAFDASSSDLNTDEVLNLSSNNIITVDNVDGAVTYNVDGAVTETQSKSNLDITDYSNTYVSDNIEEELIESESESFYFEKPTMTMDIQTFRLTVAGSVDMKSLGTQLNFGFLSNTAPEDSFLKAAQISNDPVFELFDIITSIHTLKNQGEPGSLDPKNIIFTVIKIFDSEHAEYLPTAQDYLNEATGRIFNIGLETYRLNAVIGFGIRGTVNNLDDVRNLALDVIPRTHVGFTSNLMTAVVNQVIIRSGSYFPTINTGIIPLENERIKRSIDDIYDPCAKGPDYWCLSEENLIECNVTFDCMVNGTMIKDTNSTSTYLPNTMVGGTTSTPTIIQTQTPVVVPNVKNCHDGGPNYWCSVESKYKKCNIPPFACDRGVGWGAGPGTKCDQYGSSYACKDTQTMIECGVYPERCLVQMPPLVEEDDECTYGCSTIGPITYNNKCLKNGGQEKSLCNEVLFPNYLAFQDEVYSILNTTVDYDKFCNICNEIYWCDQIYTETIPLVNCPMAEYFLTEMNPKVCMNVKNTKYGKKNN